MTSGVAGVPLSTVVVPVQRRGAADADAVVSVGLVRLRGGPERRSRVVGVVTRRSIASLGGRSLQLGVPGGKRPMPRARPGYPAAARRAEGTQQPCVVCDVRRMLTGAGRSPRQARAGLSRDPGCRKLSAPSWSTLEDTFDGLFTSVADVAPTVGISRREWAAGHWKLRCSWVVGGQRGAWGKESDCASRRSGQPPHLTAGCEPIRTCG